jgi:hypothetical protein
MESSATEIVDLRRRLNRVENELKLRRAIVSFILILLTDIFKLIIIYVTILIHIKALLS